MADEVLSAVITAKELAKFNSDMLTLIDTVDGVDKSMGRASKTLGEMGENAAKTGRSLEGIDAGQFDQLLLALQELTVQMKEQVESSENLANSLDDVADRLEDVGEESEEAGKKGRKGGEETKSAWDKVAPSLKRVGEAFLGFSLAQLAIRSIQKLREELVSSVDLFAKQEKAVVGLGVALGSLGKFNRAAIRDLQDWANGLERATGFSSDAVLSTARLIAQLGRLRGDKLKEVTEAAIETSAVLGRSLPNSALNFARFAVGFTESASDMGIIVDKTKSKMEQFNEIMQKVQSQFAGTAAIQMQTMSGRLQQLGNAWDNLKKSVGAFFAVFVPTIEKLAKRLDEWAQKMDPSYLGILDVDEKVKDFTESLKELAEAQEDLRNAKPVSIGRGEVAKPLALVQAVRRAKEEISESFGRLELTLQTTIPRADIEELKRTKEDLGTLLVRPDITPDQYRRIIALIQQVDARLPVRMELDRQDATAEIRKLTGEVEGITLKTALDDASFREALREIESERPAIQAVIDLGPDQFKDIARLGEQVRLAPAFDAAKFVKLGQDVRNAFFKALELGRAGDELQKEVALALAPLVLELERQRRVRLQVVFDVQGPEQIEARILSPAQMLLQGIQSRAVNAVQEMKVLTAAVRDLMSLGGATPVDLLQLEALSKDTANLEQLRTRIIGTIDEIKQKVSEDVAKIKLEDLKKLQAAGGDEVERAKIIAESLERQAQATAPLEAAYRRLNDLLEIYATTLGYIPPRVKAMVDKGKKDLQDFAATGKTSIDRFASSAGYGFQKVEIFSSALSQALIRDSKVGADKTAEIYHDMVNQILEDLARLAIGNFFKQLLAIDTVAKIGKVEWDQDPIQVPIEPIVPDTPIVMQGQVQFEPEAQIPNDFGEFARDLRLQAFDRQASRRVDVRVIQPEPVETEPRSLHVTLSGVNDGLSVRRQLTSGALRREILRDASRGRL